MKLLLDTHTFIWLDTAPEKLSSKALEACQNIENTLYLSVASAWEMQIKMRLNKLTLEVPLETMIEFHCDTNDLQILPVKLDHVLALQDIPMHHADPFDRLLITQAKVENAHFVTADSAIAKYHDHIKLLW